MWQVQTSYPFENSFTLDEVAFKAVGRSSDFSGATVGDNPNERDLGWECETEEEAIQIKFALAKIGMVAEVSEMEEG